MRASTGRDLLVKVEGTYHGHHDALMVSVFPSKEDAGPAEHPNSVPQTKGLAPGTTEHTVCVPFNDAEAVERLFAERGSEIAGMIVEPVMTNCGVVLPDPGYLQRLKEICHRHGAMYAFDEVKTGFTVAWGGAIEAFGVQPDLVAYAKALGAGLPCGAIGGTEDAMRMVIDGDLEQVGTFNGNPLTMAAAKVNLTEVLTKDAYVRLDEINTILHRCEDVIATYKLPASMKTLSARRGRSIGAPRRSTPTATCGRSTTACLNSRGCGSSTAACSRAPDRSGRAGPPPSCMSDEDAQRYVDNFESFARGDHELV